MFRSILSKTLLPAATRTSRTPTLTRAYHEKVISHYEQPRNVGSLPKGDIDVGTGLVGAPAYILFFDTTLHKPEQIIPDRCGDVMKLQIRVDEDGIISDVKFKTFGCGSAIASSSYMTERVKGLSLDEAGKIRNTEIAKELSLPPVKLHCSMLAEDAIRSAIRDYRSKRNTMADPKKAAGFIDVSQSTVTGETVATAHPGGQPT
ncbi:FeS cluster assembly scaffold IscU [Gautieria morchelliformis]|nr:FeS cluster assembly scaffold IscU [Gautieria morchelliformis]